MPKEQTLTLRARRADPVGNPAQSVERMSEDARVTVRRSGAPDPDGKCVVYWMQRAQRAIDNPALDVAIRVANELGKPVAVFFAPSPRYPGTNLRNLKFLQEGIPNIVEGLRRRDVGFCFCPYPQDDLPKFCQQVRAAIVIGDEDPLRGPEVARQKIARQLRIPFWTVDADVIVPTRLLGKEHYGARTIRPRLHERLPMFLTQLANPRARVPWTSPPGLRSQGWDSDFARGWKLNRSVSPVSSFRGGSKEAIKRLRWFVDHCLATYPEERNRPELDGTSRLSAYLRFGHIGPHTIALAVRAADAPETAKQAFLEQLIVRRELAVNFVRFNSSYDSMECLEPWAERSLAQHATDRRPTVYSAEQLRSAETHDPLWNAAQKQMLLTGWMHNYLRMYWAKKILEWSPSIASAYQLAVEMNDEYELDGRDPNGYAGIAWAIVGKHDRAWFERPIFGQIRYMSLASTGRKFDSKKFIENIARLERSGKKSTGDE